MDTNGENVSAQIPCTDVVFERRKSATGLLMALLYAFIYSGFVVLTVFWPSFMDGAGLFGLNLAMTYGLGLIVIAVIFAVIYNHLVRRPRSDAVTTTTDAAEADMEERPR